jgi:hypothetical protein
MTQQEPSELALVLEELAVAFRRPRAGLRSGWARVGAALAVDFLPHTAVFSRAGSSLPDPGAIEAIELHAARCAAPRRRGAPPQRDAASSMAPEIRSASRTRNAFSLRHRSIGREQLELFTTIESW